MIRRAQTVVVAMVCTILTVHPAGAFFFPTDVPVNDAVGDGMIQARPALVHGGGTLVHCVFEDDRLSPGMETLIHYSRSDDMGRTWSSVDQLLDPMPEANEHQVDPAVTIDPLSPLRLYVVYSSFQPSAGSSVVYLVASGDGGLTWGSEVAASVVGGADRVSPDLAVSPTTGELYVVYEDTGGLAGGDVLCATSTDGGLTFSQQTNVAPLSSSLARQHSPAVAVDLAGTLYVAYVGQDDDVRVSSSLDGGASFTEMGAVAPDPGYSQLTPDIAAMVPGRFAAVYTSDILGFPAIHLIASFDGGSSFTTPQAIGLPGEWARGHVEAGRFGDYFFTWSTVIPGHREVRVSRSVNGGQSVRPSIRVDRGNLDSDQPALALGWFPTRAILTAYRTDRAPPDDIFANTSLPFLADSFDDNTFDEWTRAQGVSQSFLFALDNAGSSCIFDQDARDIALLGQDFSDPQQGSVSFWFYDGYGTDIAYESTDFTFQISYDDGTKAGVVRALGVINPSSSTNYSVQDDVGTQITAIPRSAGWHRVHVEVDAGGLSFRLDPTDHPLLQPVYEDSGFTTFETLEWVGGSSTAPYALDEVDIEAEDAPQVPAAGGAALALLGVLLGGRLQSARRHRGKER